MCEVCIAEALMMGNTSKLTSSHNDKEYEIRGAAEEHPETPPCFYQISRNGEWSKEFSSDQSLADVISKCGFDTKEHHRSEEMDAFLDSHFEDKPKEKKVKEEKSEEKEKEEKKPSKKSQKNKLKEEVKGASHKKGGVKFKIGDRELIEHTIAPEEINEKPLVEEKGEIEIHMDDSDLFPPKTESEEAKEEDIKIGEIEFQTEESFRPEPEMEVVVDVDPIKIVNEEEDGKEEKEEPEPKAATKKAEKGTKKGKARRNGKT